ncbi:acyl-CoA transferase [Allopusillimonas soli]|uniref:CoA transferase n=2 Tax=Allopusillimonas soli TaxID=659016 RepID=A0A853FDB8_9BURK|nr:CoA transferase [Allopusillimonas soli]TEA74856.1 acyl-CoA transferase [Allopusillimonas soli]
MRAPDCPGLSSTPVRPVASPLRLIHSNGRAMPAPFEVLGRGALPSAFAVTELATAAIGTAALALADYTRERFGVRLPAVAVDRRLASFWFGAALRPRGWQVPAVRDAVTGDYPTRDGWLRIHANAPHHRAAALAVLGCDGSHDAAARAISRRSGQELEDALVAAHACAAVMRSRHEWSRHQQGLAVAREPLFHIMRHEAHCKPQSTHPPASGRDRHAWPSATASTARPLAGLRVLDLTRVLAGPVATRFLAGYGATVLRIDPPWWSEPGMVPEVTPGKRCAMLDLRQDGHLAQLKALLKRADVLVHGLRADALARLGLGEQERQALHPGLVDVCLDAYGWTGPWRYRRGFDSLVQMSNGIAHAGMLHFGKDRPTPLPVQALDQATGYLMAAAALRGLTERLRTGAGVATRVSLARTGELLKSALGGDDTPLAPETDADLSSSIEATEWGPAQRLRPPCVVEGAGMHWDSAASALRSAAPEWPE